MLRHGAKDVGDLPVHQAEVARVLGDLPARERVQHAVVAEGRQLLEGGLALAGRALAVDDLRAAAPHLHHLGDELRGVLQVRVDDDDRVAPGLLQARADGHLVAEVARKVHQHHVRILFLDAARKVERLVAASVVDEDELVVLLHGGHHLRQPAIALADDLFLIVEGNDDRDERFHETMGASGSNRINSTPASFKISLEKSSGYSCR